MQLRLFSVLIARVFRLLAWQRRAPRDSVPRDRKKKLPVSQGLGPETGPVPLVPYAVGQNRHRAHLKLREGYRDPTSQWEEHQKNFPCSW